MKRPGFPDQRAADEAPYDEKPEENGVIPTMTDKYKEKVLALYPAAGNVYTLAEYATGKSEDLPDAWGKPMAFCENVTAQLDRFIPPALDKVAASAPVKQ
ncbi:hypothetical protein [Burkholderia sp. F1]|uniref:hypothetical protein n=1 Tax=Burkholderia sp. F1 TaxID=3366817 RepID=UPI003D7601FB